MNLKYIFLFGFSLFFSFYCRSQVNLSLSVENCNTFKAEILRPLQSDINKVQKSYLLEVEILKDVWAKIGTIKTKSNTVRFENQETNGRYRASLVDHQYQKVKGAMSKNLKSNIQYSNPVDFNKNLACNLALNPTKIDMEKGIQFNVYPNPVQSILIIETNDLEIGAQAEIRDIQGRRIMNFNIQNGRNAINVNQLKNGVYFLKLVHSANYSEVKKIFVNASKS